MKINNVNALTLLTYCSTLLLTFASASAIAALQIIQVDLKYNQDEANPKLEVTNDGDCDTSGGDSNPNGCVESKTTKYTKIQFVLDQADWSDWTITEVRICVDSGGMNKISSGGCTLNKLDRYEFAATRNGTQRILHPDVYGVLPIHEFGNNVNWIFLLSMNNRNRDYWYRVTACKRNNWLTCITSDPPLRNRGR